MGAGPSGLLLALNLARAGIKVRVLEAATEPDNQPRAILYGPAAVRELGRAGVLGAMRARGSRVPGGVSWRRGAGQDAALLAQLPKPPPPPPGGQEPAQAVPDGGPVSLSLNLMVEILLEAVQAEPNAVVEFGRRVLDVDQDDASAWVTCEKSTTSSSSKAEEEDNKVEASYVVGCDGSSSTVRASLFGKDFPGYTWDPWLVAVNVRFPDAAAFYEQAGLTDINFLLHPTDWCFIARIGAPEPLWRVTYGDDGALARDVVARPERVLARLRTVLPAALSSSSASGSFEVVGASPYRAHQRCAPRFRAGRVLLAADAAHLCNPFGGMGLTNGIVDVGALADCLGGMHRGVASPAILDRYDAVRRAAFRDVVDKITTANFARIMQDPAEALAKDPLLVACREAETDPAVAVKVGEMMRVSLNPPSFFFLFFFFLGMSYSNLSTSAGTGTVEP